MNKSTTITDTAKEVLRIEADTVKELIGAVNYAFEEAVNTIHQCKSRVIVTGIGKSAIIGQKIVATFNSTGTAAIFMHAADALHGDIGMVQRGDVVLCISKSGESPEIKALLPLILQLGNPVIAMVSNPQSTLARQASIMIHIPVAREADPNGLAPTASTTAQIAMGDALAISILCLRGFNSNDFANRHPGGSLGKKMYLRVCDLTTLHEKPVVKADYTIQQVILEMTSKRLGATAVLSDYNVLEGIITDGDLRRMLSSHPDWTKLTAKDIMTIDPKLIHENALAIEALKVLRKHSITQLIAINEKGKYAGMVHIHDILKEGII